jgi:hypothetical protein
LRQAFTDAKLAQVAGGPQHPVRFRDQPAPIARGIQNLYQQYGIKRRIVERQMLAIRLDEARHTAIITTARRANSRSIPNERSTPT